MSRGTDATQWTAEQTLSYINGLIAAEDNGEQGQYSQTLYTALSITYEYLTNATKRKITWSLSLEKLAYEFIELAFETNMHSSVKDIFKSYRAITQGQYSESLKYVLEHYRDKKLQVILEEEISAADLPLIRSLPNIQIQQPSPEIILESLHPQAKQKLMTLRNKLKIVWEGYKSIVETVRVNQKLEDVYMATLNKIFDFVDRYNRVQEFKVFCKSLRTGLQTAFNKRDKSEQQKAIYIDIEKTDVNNRNIEIRMEQFKITTKLGLWTQSFQVLEDINTLIKIRKSPLKNSLRCQYYESLALLFSKNNFWHYHAFAFYNYYTAYLTKPKITAEERQKLADKLLLSILAIPRINIENNQSKDIQQKVCGMMITSTKVPSKNQLVQLMVSKGVLENASKNVNELWNFMLLQFEVSSLKKGLQLVAKLNTASYQEYHNLIQATLINRQLLSIAQVYQRIRISSLERLIPLPLQKIKKILILAHKQKTLDFTFDQNQGILVFQDKTQLINPTTEFYQIFISVSIANELQRTLDETFIKKKAEDFLKNAENNIWTIRQYKIDEYKRKLKKPMQDMIKAGYLRQKKKQQDKKREEEDRKYREIQAIRKGEESQKILAAKRIIINDIISIKQQRVVRIMQKKIQNLTDEEIQNLSLEVLNQYLQATKKKIANNKQARLKKAFLHVDYIERERRERLIPKIKEQIHSTEEDEKAHQFVSQISKKHFDEHHVTLEKLKKITTFYKDKIQSEVKIVTNKFDDDLANYKKKLAQNFKEKIMAKAKALCDENLKKKEDQKKLTELQQRAIDDLEYMEGNWSFRNKKTANNGAPPPRQEPKSFNFRDNNKSTNVFEKLDKINDDYEKKERPSYNPTAAWGKGTKMNQPSTTQEPQKKQTSNIAFSFKPVEKKQQKQEEIKPEPEIKKPQKFVPPPLTSTQSATNTAAQKKGKGWAAENQLEKKQEKKPQPAAEVKKGKNF